MFIIIVFWLGCDRPLGLPFFVPALLLSIFTPLFLHYIFVCFFVFILSCCSHAWVFRETLVHEFPMSCSHTEWYLHFFARRNSLFGPKIRLSKSNYTKLKFLLCVKLLARFNYLELYWFWNYLVGNELMFCDEFHLFALSPTSVLYGMSLGICLLFITTAGQYKGTPYWGCRVALCQPWVPSTKP